MKKEAKKNHNSRKKTLTGVVISAKMEKTAVVSMRRLREHPKYRKRYWVTTTYKAENPENRYKEGEKVIIQESRPLSKEKRWIILGRVSERSEPTRR